MKSGLSSRHKPLKPLLLHPASPNASDTYSTSPGRISIEKIAVSPTLKSTFSKVKHSVNFVFPGYNSKSGASTNVTSPYGTSHKAGFPRKQSSRIEEIQPDRWEKTERHIKFYNTLMDASRVKSPQFYTDRRGSMGVEVDNSDLKLRAKFDAHASLRTRDFGSSISTLKNPEGGTSKPLVENIFNEQPMKILDVRKHNLEAFYFKPEAVKNESAAERVPKGFTHQNRAEKTLDIPTRKRNEALHNKMFYKKFYYG